MSTELSVQISRLCRGTTRAVEQFLAGPITTADLVALWTDPASEWARRLDALPLNAGQEARVALTKLTALVGEDGSVLDHGWFAGTDQITVAHIAEEVAGLEAQLAPLVRLRKRRAAA